MMKKIDVISLLTAVGNAPLGSEIKLSDHEIKQEVKKYIYIPEIEEVECYEGDESAVDSWQDFGEYDTLNDAKAQRDEMIEMIQSGEYPIDEGHYHAICISVYDSETDCIDDVIDVISNVEKYLEEKSNE